MKKILLTLLISIILVGCENANNDSVKIVEDSSFHPIEVEEIEVEEILVEEILFEK